MNLFIDIGGTKFRIAQAEIGSNLFQSPPQMFDTPFDYHDFLEFINQIDIIKNKFFNKVIIGIPGAFNYSNNQLGNLVNLPDWSGKQITKDLGKIINTNLINIYNDTKMVAYGEVFYGTGQSLNNNKIAYLTISTGVNAYLIDKENNLTKSLSQPEIGHMIIESNIEKTWEDLIGGKSLAEEFKCDILQVPSHIWQERAKYVAIGIYNISLFWQPEIVIIGGSMVVKEIGFKINDIEKNLALLKNIYDQKPKLLQAKLGGLGGLYGGLYFANNI